jgi:DnaK suppressor protein
MTLDLVAIRARLEELRLATFVQEEQAKADSAPVELDQESVGRLSRIDAMQMQAMAIAVQRRRQMERDRIDAALSRLETGEYGFCSVCGEEIAPARLVHNPAVVTCVSCAK